MKIIQSLSFYPNTGGGLEVVVNELTKELQNAGINTLLITQGDKTKLEKVKEVHLKGMHKINFAGRETSLGCCKAREATLGYTNKTVSKFYIKSLGDGHMYVPVFSIKNLKKLFFQLNKFSPDLVHIHNVAALDYAIYVWAVVNNIPIINTIHAVPSRIHKFVDFNIIAEKILKLGFINKYFFMMFNNSSGIIALNDVIIDELKNLNINTDVFKINNGRHIKKFLPKSATKNIKSKTINLLFLGHISNRKNQLYLVEMMRFLPRKYSLTLAGEIASKQYLSKIKSKLKQYDIKNVKIIGQINQDEVIKTLHNTHIFVSSSKAEVQSLVIIEALASGTPIIALENETTQELVTSNVGKLLSKDATPKQFAKEIIKITFDKNKYDKMCQETIKTVSKFDWATVINQTSTTYKKVIKKSKLTQQNYSSFQKLQRYIRNFLLLSTLPLLWLISKLAIAGLRTQVKAQNIKTR